MACRSGLAETVFKLLKMLKDNELISKQLSLALERLTFGIHGSLFKGIMVHREGMLS